MELDDMQLSPDIEYFNAGDVETTRESREPGTKWRNYPALSVPLGPEDEFNCPPEHVDHLKRRLAAHDGLHIVTIGYSGFDSSVLKLLEESSNTLRSLYVVNGTVGASMDAAHRIASVSKGTAGPDMAHPAGFFEFTQSGAIERHLESL